MRRRLARWLFRVEESGALRYILVAGTMTRGGESERCWLLTPKEDA